MTPTAGPSIDAIQRCVAAHYGLEVAALVSDRRPQHLAHARDVALLLCDLLTSKSAVVVAKKFNRDPSTVSKRWIALRRELNTSPRLAEEIRTLREAIAAAQRRAEHSASCAHRSPSSLRQVAREKSERVRELSEEVAWLLAEADALEGRSKRGAIAPLLCGR